MNSGIVRDATHFSLPCGHAPINPWRVPNTQQLTADELLAYDAGGQRTELIRGQLVVREPAGGAHAGVLFELSMAIGLYLRTPQPGVCW